MCSTGLTEAHLDAIAPFPWPSRPDRTRVANMVAWVDAELMKNVAEIGQQRILAYRIVVKAGHRKAGPAPGQDEAVTYPALLPTEGIARLREALAVAGYTSAGIAARIGPAARPHTPQRLPRRCCARPPTATRWPP